MLKFKISPKSILILVLSSCLLNLNGLKALSGLIDSADAVIRVLSAIIIVGWYLLRKNKSLSYMTVMILLMTGMMFISTLLADGDLIAWFIKYAPIFALGLLFEISLSDFNAYLKATMFLMVCLCLVHLLIIIIFPDGLYEDRLGYRAGNFLMGQKNVALPYLLVACVTAFFYGYYSGNKFIEITVYSLCIVSSVLVRSSTSMVGLTLLVALFIFVRLGMKFKIYPLLAVNVIIFTIFVVFRMRIPIITYFIENLLHKNVTLTGRDVIWNMSLEFIKKRPVLGYGVQSNLARFGTFGLRWNLYAHNQVLQELFDGGVVQLFLYVLFIIMISIKLNRDSDLITSQAMIVTLFVLNIMFITEGYANKYLYLVYYYAYYAPSIERRLGGMKIGRMTSANNTFHYYLRR